MIPQRLTDFLEQVRSERHKSFFELLHDICYCYGKSPCYYLFPDVECPHFILLVDTLVYNVGRPPQLKAEWQRAALSAGAKVGALT